MKSTRLALVLAVICMFSGLVQAQSAPNYENGWKPFGSYDGSHLDTVNLMNGNVMLHAPIIPDVPQRGAFSLGEILYTTSKDWQAICTPNTSQPSGMLCLWKNGGSQLQVQTSVGMTVTRTLETLYQEGTPTVYSTFNYSLTTMDGATHLLAGAGSLDATNSFTKFDTFDLTGYHVEVTTPDANGVGTTAIITDRRGMQYQGVFSGSAPGTSPVCRIPQTSTNLPHSSSGIAPMIDDSSGGAADCSQAAFASLATDSNGNQMILTPRAESSTARDTLGRIPQFFVSGPAYNSADPTGCGGAHPFYYASVLYYIAPDGSTQPLKLCYSQLTVHTAFNQVAYGTIPIGDFDSSTLSGPYAGLTSVILADGTKWTFDYDNYGEVTYIGLPTGGSIAYTWTTISFSSCDFSNPAPVSRAVSTRTLNDGQGHIQEWHYNWGTANSSGLTNMVTDPLGNDTVHIYKQQAPSVDNLPPACSLYETSTINYQGSQSAGHVLQRVDTVYNFNLFNVQGGIVAGIGGVFATDITTTVYPSGKVKKVHKDPDSGPTGGGTLFGNVKKELEYDWGQGAPGALLRETDTTYEWEINPAYVTAHIVDLPASVIVKDGSGNRVAETDYTYDEPAYLTAPTPAVTTQHTTPPYGVRGDMTTVSRWLNTANSFISSHTNWYDTGEVFQKSDPLGHTTTYSYDPAYAGGYVTQTCLPQTGSVTHCVSGTYDFNTGVLTSLTNENATSQASGNSQGDATHTSNYNYDTMFRITSAQAPPDSANSGARAQHTFSFSAPNAFPVSVQRTKSVTNALSDSATSFFDGLGRSYKSQHAVPGNIATVDTTFDAAGRAATVSNPYFSTADPTYGTTTSLYDALDRVTQVTKQDGSISHVYYNVAVSLPGNCTDTVDEANNQRRTCSDALGRLVEVYEPNPGSVATPAQATITIGGTLNNQPNVGAISAAAGGGSLTIIGAGGLNVDQSKNVLGLRYCAQYNIHGTCVDWEFEQDTIFDAGMVTMTVNGHATSVPYGSGSSTTTIASALATAINNDTAAFVNASASGVVLTLTARHNGAATNYSWSLSCNSTDSADFGSAGSFSASAAAGTLSGGSNGFGGVTVYDAGTVTLTIGSFTASASYSQSGNNSAPQIAAALVGSGTTGLNRAGSPVSAIATGASIALTYNTAGAAGDSVTVAASSQSTQTQWTFSPASFAAVSSSFGNGLNAGDLNNQPFVTQYQYDALGNLLRVDQKGTAPSDSTQWRTRTFTYDSLSRLLMATNPESGTISYAYDADGSLLQKTSPAPNQTGSATQTVSYCYDALHRGTGKGYGTQSCPLSSPVVSYVYDSGANAKGKLVSLTDQAGTASYTYDTLGRLSTETRTLTGAGGAAISKNLSYEYNLDGSLKTLHYPSGAAVTYTPDSAGRITQAVDSGNNIGYATGATYGPDGAPTSFVSGYSSSFAGITNAFAYNKRLQPLTMSATAPSQTVYSIGYDFHYGAGNNGNIFGIYNYKDANRNQTFTYDALNRLTSAQNAGTDCTAKILRNKSEYWGNNYVYDGWGNMLQKSVTKCGAENLQVTADAHNWIHTSAPDYQYDAAGNMTYDATASLSYTFDQENRLTGAGGYTYTYDGDGNRIRKSNGTTAGDGTLYWAMTPGVVAETDLAGTTKSEYVFFDGERVARRDGVNGAGGVFYYFSDHLKTASVITDSAGVIKAESDYYPWGGELQFVNNDTNDYKFTGKKRDAETGLDYFGARYYSNGLGRWVSADWSPKPVPVPYADYHDPQSLNLYGFVGGNPASKADPDGHDGATATATWDLFAGGGTDVSAGMWATGSVALPGMLGGGLAYIALDTAAGNNYTLADAGIRDVVATNQLMMARQLALSQDAQAGALIKEGKDANSAAAATIDAAIKGIAAGKYKDPVDVQEHIDKLNEGMKAVARATEALKNAVGQKARDAAKKVLEKATKEVKGHEKDLRTKPPKPPKSKGEQGS